MAVKKDTGKLREKCLGFGKTKPSVLNKIFLTVFIFTESNTKFYTMLSQCIFICSINNFLLNETKEPNEYKGIGLHNRSICHIF